MKKLVFFTLFLIVGLNKNLSATQEDTHSKIQDIENISEDPSPKNIIEEDELDQIKSHKKPRNQRKQHHIQKPLTGYSYSIKNSNEEKNKSNNKE